jgi:hypothetical protein
VLEENGCAKVEVEEVEARPKAKTGEECEIDNTTDVEPLGLVTSVAVLASLMAPHILASSTGEPTPDLR